MMAKLCREGRDRSFRLPGTREAMRNLSGQPPRRDGEREGGGLEVHLEISPSLQSFSVHEDPLSFRPTRTRPLLFGPQALGPPVLTSLLVPTKASKLSRNKCPVHPAESRPLQKTETHMECGVCICYRHSHSLAVPSLRNVIHAGFCVDGLRPPWFL